MTHTILGHLARVSPRRFQVDVLQDERFGKTTFEFEPSLLDAMVKADGSTRRHYVIVDQRGVVVGISPHDER